MPKPKMLFVDDDPKRMLMAIRLWDEWEITLASTVQEALRCLSHTIFDCVSLDHDLGRTTFQDPDDPESGSAILRYIQKCGWPFPADFPAINIHSYNTFAAHAMKSGFFDLGFPVRMDQLEYPKYKQGMIAGAFDVIHPGYIRLFRFAREICERLTIALYVDPSIEHPNKTKPILSVEERTEILLGMKYVDDVIPYNTEDDLFFLLSRADVRIVGGDHSGSTSRPNLQTPTVYHSRDHDWSATRFKEMIRDSFKEQK